MPIVGIDIGSYSIKVVELSASGQTREVSVVASTYNPVGHYLPDDQKQFESLVVAIKTLLTEYKIVGKKAAIALPETSIFSSFIDMPSLSETELSSAISWEAEQHLPVSLETVNLEYTVIDRAADADGKMKVLLVAAKKSVVEKLIQAAELLEVELVAVESGLLSLGRSFVATYPNSAPTLLANFGALSTDLVIVADNKPIMMHSIPNGGLALTRAVERGLGLQPSQAEEYKRTYGFLKDQLEGRVAATLAPVFTTVLSEIRKTIQYYQSDGVHQVGKILLYGGSAYVPDLASFVTGGLGLEAITANPFDGMTLSAGLRLPIETASFGVACGLAMREEE